MKNKDVYMEEYLKAIQQGAAVEFCRKFVQPHYDINFDLPLSAVATATLIAMWMEEEYVNTKIWITKKEKNILDAAIFFRYSFIARDKDGSLFLFYECPKKEGHEWRAFDDNCQYFHEDDSSYLTFIKWEDEKPWSIENILNNCEVIDS